MSVSFSYLRVIKTGYPAHMEDPYANYWMELENFGSRGLCYLLKAEANNISRSLDDSRYHGKTESIANNRFNMNLLFLIPKSGPLK